MSDSQEQPWSDSPNAPKIPSYIYRFEKTWFAGVLVGSILHGTRKKSLLARPSVRAHCSFYSRDARRPVLQLRGNAFKPRLSQSQMYQVGARVLRHGHVLTSDRVRGDECLHALQLLCG